ncbi:uncharacterized protein B0H18DRAFT_844521, partial [Fomitopsis serialis]|uniref:uncharacterized protein n=1 Tax=Fomitopsis serialis TaxID=139415 RepID=UPI002007737E
EDNTCPACDKPLKSASGLMAHLSTARSCLWYRKGKNREPRCHAPEVVDEEAPPAVDMDVDVEDFRDASTSSSTSHVPAQPLQMPPGPALDDDDNTRVEDEDELAGRVIRMETSIVETWRAYFGEDEDGENPGKDDRMDELDRNKKWKPFASELDWRVAMWVVREDVGQKSINRFLSIPGVVDKLGLTFKDIRELFMKIDDIPDRAAWKTSSLAFPDRPDEKHLVRYRDILEAIKALLGNPSYAKYIVYRPKRVFTDRSRTKRIFTEMWTGLW